MTSHVFSNRDTFPWENSTEPIALEVEASKKSPQSVNSRCKTLLNNVARVTEDIFPLSKIFSLTAYSLIGIRTHFGISDDLHRFYEKLQATRVIMSTFLTLKQISYFYSSDYKKDCQERKYSNVTENSTLLILTISDIFHILEEVNVLTFAKAGMNIGTGFTIIVDISFLNFSKTAMQEFSRITNSLEKKSYTHSKFLKSVWYTSELAVRMFALLGNSKGAVLPLKIIAACLGIISFLFDKSLVQCREEEEFKKKKYDYLTKTIRQ